MREAIIRVSHEGPKTPCLSRPTASLPACSRYLDPACLRGIGVGIMIPVGQLILDADASNPEAGNGLSFRDHTRLAPLLR